jgi:hypothetical protein
MDEGVDPKNMCQRMVTVIDEYAELESLANPEIRTLFIDWMEELEAEVLAYCDKTQEIIPDDLAARFKISRQGAEFLIEKMKKENKLK